MGIVLGSIKEQLDYSPATGLFRWKVSKPRAAKGSIAGFSCKKGYKRIKMSGVNYAAHRLAWLLSEGVWPTGQLDHINGIKDDNRRCNLREASNGQNCANRAVQARTKTGFKGVTRMGRKFQASCRVNKKLHCLGTFATPEEASKAYVQFAQKHHGQFFNANVIGDSKMARPKSVVLSKDEKKAVVTELKAKLKAVKDAAKQLAGVRKEVDKAYAVAGKAHVAALKQNDKESAAVAKIVSDLEAQLAALTLTETAKA